MKVQLIHGLEGSPTGAKARYLRGYFELLAPSMDTTNFEASVAVQAEALRGFEPDVLVGSSFGGAVALALLQRGLWQGPTLLLAPAVGYFGVAPSVPEGVSVSIVHGTRDAICPLEQSRILARTGSPGRVELVEVDDEHRLDSLLASDSLAELVRGLGARADRG